ncbi:sensor histidine kinase [Fusibacter sp. JL298sf-3]
MKIRTKFIIALALLILIPILFSINITSSIFSDHLRFVPYLDDYDDIFSNFSKSSQAFDDILTAYAKTPTAFLSPEFQAEVEANFSSPFIIVEIWADNQRRYTSYQSEYDDGTFLERFVFDWIQADTSRSAYMLKQHLYTASNGDIIDVRFMIDSERLALARQVFQRLFFIFYAIANLVLITVLITWISKPVQRRLARLAHTTSEIGKGNYYDKLSYRENDDFTELARSIENMRIALKRAMEKQVQLEKEKKELIANISHDLKTPVTSIRGYAQGLRDGVARTEEMQREYLETIESKTYMIESLVNDLSEISGYDSGGIALSPQIVDLRGFLTDCIDELEKDVKKCGGTLSLHYIIKDTQIRVDPEKLMRVFINIIENAIKYRSHRPVEVIILANRDDDGVFINISDNGIGVPEEDTGRLFDRFYRSDKSRNLNVGGSGIGLSICKEIIESHGGKISASSNDSDGLTISIRLPDYLTEEMEP